jgi:outer membrane protein assembly factor BamE (lipoprotein component of BamABCDE complex)
MPGGSTGAQVEAVMGTPDERLARPDGTTVLYYSRNPTGRHAYAVTLGPDGVMRGIDQLLTTANINKLASGTTTSKQVRELLGPPYPYTVTRPPFMQREVWEYRWLDAGDKRVLWVHFSGDGILREVINTHDFEADEPTGSSGGSLP